MSCPEVVIERLAVGGNGVGRVDGTVCFVPCTAPGDRLTVRIAARKKNYLEAEMVELLEPSSLRVQPLCPAFGQCGGCDWQHLAYEEQCRAKQEMLGDVLTRIGRMQSPSVAGIVAAPSAYGYRARAQFKLHATDSGLAVGFFRRGSRFVIDLPGGCPIVTPAIHAAMQRLRPLLTSLSDRNRIPQVSMEDGERGVVAIVHYLGHDTAGLVRFLRKHEDGLELAGLFVQPGRKETLSAVFGSGTIEYLVPAGAEASGVMSLSYDIGGFSQVNRSQNRRMIDLVRNLLEPKPSDRLLDLYCGNGNLSLPLASQLAGLVGMEAYAPSIASAIDNARQLRVNNSTFRCCTASGGLSSLIADKERFDAVLLDPPRTGAADLTGDLLQLGAGRLVYVSCDPATLARDAAVLAGSGYYLKTAVPLDMFPQTAHLETVALFQRT